MFARPRGHLTGFSWVLVISIAVLLVGLLVQNVVTGFPTTPSTEQPHSPLSAGDEPELTAVDGGGLPNNFQGPIVMHYVRRPPQPVATSTQQNEPSQSSQHYTVNALHTSAAWLDYIQLQKTSTENENRLHSSVNITWAGITDSKRVQNLPTSRNAKWKDMSSMITPTLLDNNDIEDGQTPTISVSLCRPTIRIFVTTHPDITAHAAAAAANGLDGTAVKESETFATLDEQPHPERLRNDDMCFLTILSSRAQLNNNNSEISKVHAHRLPDMTQLARRGVIYFIHVPYRWLFLPASKSDNDNNRDHSNNDRSKSNNVERTRASVLDIKYAVTSCSAIFDDDDEQHGSNTQQQQRQEDDWSENSKITTTHAAGRAAVVAQHHPALTNLNQIQLGTAQVEQLCVQSSETTAGPAAVAASLDDGESDSNDEDDNQIVVSETADTVMARDETSPDYNNNDVEAESKRDCRSSCQTQRIIFRSTITKSSSSSHSRRAKRHFKTSFHEQEAQYEHSKTVRNRRQKQQIYNISEQKSKNINFVRLTTRQRALYVEMPSAKHNVAVGERLYVAVYLQEKVSNGSASTTERQLHIDGLQAFTLKVHLPHSLHVVGIGEFFQQHETPHAELNSSSTADCHSLRRGEWRFSAEKHSQRSLSVTAVEITRNDDEVPCETQLKNYPLFVFIMERSTPDNEQERTAESTALTFTLSHNITPDSGPDVVRDDDEEEAQVKRPPRIQTVHARFTRPVRLTRAATVGGQHSRATRLVVNMPRVFINTAVLSSSTTSKKRYFPVFLYAVDGDNNVLPLHDPHTQHEYEVQCNANNLNIKILSSSTATRNHCSRLMLDGREMRGGITQIHFRFYRRKPVQPTTETFRSDKLLSALQAELEKWNVQKTDLSSSRRLVLLQTVKIPIKIWFPEFPIVIDVSTKQLRPIENWRRDETCSNRQHEKSEIFVMEPLKFQCFTRFVLLEHSNNNNKTFLVADDAYVDVTREVSANVRFVYVDSTNTSETVPAQKYGSVFVPTHSARHVRTARLQHQSSRQHPRAGKYQQFQIAGQSRPIKLYPTTTNTLNRRQLPLCITGMQADLFTGLQSLVVAEHITTFDDVAQRTLRSGASVASHTGLLGNFVPLRAFITPQLLSSSSSSSIHEDNDATTADLRADNAGFLPVFVKLHLQLSEISNGEITQVDVDDYDPTYYRLHVKYFFVDLVSNKKQQIEWWHRHDESGSGRRISLTLDIHRKTPMRLVFSLFGQLCATQSAPNTIQHAAPLATADVILTPTFTTSTRNIEEEPMNPIAKFKILTPAAASLGGLDNLFRRSQLFSENEKQDSATTSDAAKFHARNVAEENLDGVASAYVFRGVDKMHNNNNNDRYISDTRIAHSVTVGLAIVVMLSTCLAAVAWITCSRLPSTKSAAVVVLARGERTRHGLSQSKKEEYDVDENDDSDEADGFIDKSRQRIGSLCCSSHSEDVDVTDDDNDDEDEQEDVYYTAVRCFGGKIYRSANRAEKSPAASRSTASSACGEEALDDNTLPHPVRNQVNKPVHGADLAAPPPPVLPRVPMKSTANASRIPHVHTSERSTQASVENSRCRARRSTKTTHKHSGGHGVQKSTSIHSIVSSSTSLAKEWVWLGRNALCTVASTAANAVAGNGGGANGKSEIYTRLKPASNEGNNAENCCLTAEGDKDDKCASFDEVERMQAVLQNLDIVPTPTAANEALSLSRMELFSNPVADSVSASGHRNISTGEALPTIPYDVAEGAVAAHLLYNNNNNTTGSLFVRAHKAQQPTSKHQKLLHHPRGHKSQPTSPMVLPRFDHSSIKSQASFLPALLSATNEQRILALSRETKLC